MGLRLTSDRPQDSVEVPVRVGPKITQGFAWSDGHPGVCMEYATICRSEEAGGGRQTLRWNGEVEQVVFESRHVWSATRNFTITTRSAGSPVTFTVLADFDARGIPRDSGLEGNRHDW